MDNQDKIKEFIKNIICENSNITKSIEITKVEALKDNIFKIHIQSDDLNLQDKISIEKAIKQAPSEEDFVINFKKSSSNSQLNKKWQWQTQGTQKKDIPNVKKIITVGSCKGGVGKSTVATNLACNLSQLGYRVGLLDADLYGPSSFILLGIQEKLSLDEQERITPIEAYGIKAVSFGGLLDNHEFLNWRGPLASQTLLNFCFKVEWGQLDYLIVDLPPGTGDIPITLTEKLNIFTSLLVTTPNFIAHSDLLKEISMFQKNNIPILGIVENLSEIECQHCHKVTSLQTASTQDIYNIPVLQRLPLDFNMQKFNDAGTPACLNSVFYQEKFNQISRNLISRN